MRTDIINYLQKEIRKRCESPNNKFGIGVYYHIEAVVKNAKLLAEKNGADLEIVIIAAWLHDIASITDYSLYEQHHIHGAEMAEEILKTFDYPAGKIEIVKTCIKTHRGSVPRTKTAKEETYKECICVADADAISHFDNIPSLLFLAYSTKKMGYEEGKAFVKGKLSRSYAKLSQESKNFYAKKYDTIMELLY